METLTATKNTLENTLLSEEVQNIINSSTAKVSALAALPIPLLDIAGMTYVQVSMVRKLAEIYRIDSENKNTLVISSFISSLVSKLISEVVESLAVSAGIDKILGESLVRASISGFFIKITGEIYNDHFQKGGTLDNITVSTFADYIITQLKSDRYSVDTLASNFMDNALDKLGVA